MDRFNSKEKLEWDQAAFNAGRKARRAGERKITMSMAPSKFWLDSWRAGWSDEDMAIASEGSHD